MSCLALDQFQSLDIQGKDAQTFIQGLTTQNVLALTPNQAYFTAFCNQKGRVIASGILCLMSIGHYRFITQKDSLKILLQHLRRYKLRSDTTFTDATPSIIGYIGIPDSLSSLGPFHEGQIIETDAGTILCYDAHTPRFLTWSGISPNDEQHSDAWTWCDIINKTPIISEKLQMLFTAHALRYHEGNMIDFSKGCYLGQEIIARTHHLGKVKKKLAQYVHDTASITVGSECLSEDGTPAGTILLSCKNHSLAVISESALANPLHVEDNGSVIALTPKTLD